MLNTENRHQDSHAEESSEGEIVALLLGKWAIGPNSPSWGEKVSICTRQGEAVVGDGPDELEQYVNCELPDVQAGFRKGR